MVHFNSSWVLFSSVVEESGNMSDEEAGNGGNQFRPYKFSGKNHSFDQQVERPILS
jgi:hypothetical protein